MKNFKLFNYLECSNCKKTIGKLFYQNKIDYDGVLCEDCKQKGFEYYYVNIKKRAK